MITSRDFLNRRLSGVAGLFTGWTLLKPLMPPSYRTYDWMINYNVTVFRFPLFFLPSPHLQAVGLSLITAPHPAPLPPTPCLRKVSSVSFAVVASFSRAITAIFVVTIFFFFFNSGSARNPEGQSGRSFLRFRVRSLRQASASKRHAGFPCFLVWDSLFRSPRYNSVSVRILITQFLTVRWRQEETKLWNATHPNCTERARRVWACEKRDRHRNSSGHWKYFQIIGAVVLTASAVLSITKLTISAFIPNAIRNAHALKAVYVAIPTKVLPIDISAHGRMCELEVIAKGKLALF